MTTLARTAENYENEIRKGSEDATRFLQDAGHSDAAMNHLKDAMERGASAELIATLCAHHSNWLPNRFLGCLALAMKNAYKADWLGGNEDAPVGMGSPNYYATRAIAFFGDQVSLAWEQEIINSVVANRYATPAERETAYTELKKTFAPMTISVRGGSPTLKIGQEVPRLISPGESVSEMSPKLGSPVVLDFRGWPALLSEGDGNILTVVSPPRVDVGGKRISYTHDNEAIYQVERYSTGEGEPNPVSVAYVNMSRAQSVSISLYKTFRDNPTLARGDVSRTLLGIRTTITRVETDAPDEDA